MSKRINVNPDHYKAAGRERPGDAAAARAATERSIAKARNETRWPKKKGSAR
jgi:hypothetical protein